MLNLGRGVLSVGKAALTQTLNSSRTHALTVHELLEKHAAGQSLNSPEKLKLASTAAIWALSNPYQGQGIAVLAEITGEDALRGMRERMLTDEDGREILQNRIPAIPIIEDSPRPGTLGSLLQGCVLDERAKVTLVDDPELAFVMRRYRDAHDILHVLTGLPVTVAGEIALKWFELASTGLPMTTLSAVFGLMRAEPGSSTLLAEWIPWAATAGRRGRFYLAVDYGKHLDCDVQEFREKVMGWPPLPTSLQDNEVILEHYNAAIRQALREGREATALKHEKEKFEQSISRL